MFSNNIWKDIFNIPLRIYAHWPSVAVSFMPMQGVSLLFAHILGAQVDRSLYQKSFMIKVHLSNDVNIKHLEAGQDVYMTWLGHV